MFKTKSIATKAEASDGLRILASRFRGHGVPASAYDVWMPNLGPTEKLLKEFKARKVDWAEFSRRYRDEIFADSSIDKDNRTIKNHGQKFTLRLLQRIAQDETITLMCQCAEQEPHCHRHLLAKILQKKI
ncbi:MAG: hypothetical protein JWO95_3397 [Verrucomicrobiales bacterium]|nr:hypothetical protein [Verrucomicrobiales bacterium]